MLDVYAWKCLACGGCDCCCYVGDYALCDDYQGGFYDHGQFCHRYLFIRLLAFGVALFNIVFWVSLVNIFFVRSPMLNLVISWALGIVYTIYLLVDTQMILGGKNKNLTLDNYALGAIIIYTDIIQLFLQILKVLGKKKKEWSETDEINKIHFISIFYSYNSLIKYISIKYIKVGKYYSYGCKKWLSFIW